MLGAPGGLSPPPFLLEGPLCIGMLGALARFFPLGSAALLQLLLGA
jgi:hypothetical protein